jgi:hypothetical protein
MVEFPLGPFSTIEVLGVVELEPTLQRARDSMQARC